MEQIQTMLSHVQGWRFSRVTWSPTPSLQQDVCGGLTAHSVAKFNPNFQVGMPIVGYTRYMCTCHAGVPAGGNLFDTPQSFTMRDVRHPSLPHSMLAVDMLQHRAIFTFLLQAVVELCFLSWQDASRGPCQAGVCRWLSAPLLPLHGCSPAWVLAMLWSVDARLFVFSVSCEILSADSFKLSYWAASGAQAVCPCSLTNYLRCCITRRSEPQGPDARGSACMHASQIPDLSKLSRRMFFEGRGP